MKFEYLQLALAVLTGFIMPILFMIGRGLVKKLTLIEERFITSLAAIEKAFYEKLEKMEAEHLGSIVSLRKRIEEVLEHYPTREEIMKGYIHKDDFIHTKKVIYEKIDRIEDRTSRLEQEVASYKAAGK